MNEQDAIRATLAGRAAIAVTAASEVLHQAAGRRLLSAPVRDGVRRVLQDLSGRAAAASTRALGRAAALAELEPPRVPITYASRAALGRTVASRATSLAIREITRGAVRAAGVGFVVDGAFGVGRAVEHYRTRAWDRRRACMHVLKEASTGAAASGAGVLAASAAVVLTGGLAAPVVMGIAAGGSILAKLALMRAVGD